MTQDMLFALIAFATVTSVTPGPNNLMLLASGANFGLRRTLPHMLGISLGHLAMILLLGAGLAGIFALYAQAHTALKFLSVGYMLYLAWKIANAAPPGDQPGTPTARPLSFIQAALFQWVNPKAWAMALGALAAYAPEGSGMAGVGIVALVFAAVNLPSVTCWAALGTQMRRLLDVKWKLRLFNMTAALLLLASLYPILTTELG